MLEHLLRSDILAVIINLNYSNINYKYSHKYLKKISFYNLLLEKSKCGEIISFLKNTKWDPEKIANIIRLMAYVIFNKNGITEIFGNGTAELGIKIFLTFIKFLFALIEDDCLIELCIIVPVTKITKFLRIICSKDYRKLKIDSKDNTEFCKLLLLYDNNIINVDYFVINEIATENKIKIYKFLMLFVNDLDIAINPNKNLYFVKLNVLFDTKYNCDKFSYFDNYIKYLV